MDVEIEHRPDYLYVRISGEYQDVFPVEIAPSNLAKICQDSLYNRMLIDAREFLGKLNILARYEVAAEFAKAFPAGSMRAAIVESAERSEPVSFVETVAVNRGAALKVFTEIDKATEWLSAHGSNLEERRKTCSRNATSPAARYAR